MRLIKMAKNKLGIKCSENIVNLIRVTEAFIEILKKGPEALFSYLIATLKIALLFLGRFYLVRIGQEVILDVR